MMTKLRSLLLVLTVLSTACVSYVATDVSQVSPQDKVRLELDAEQVNELITFVDPANRSITGRVVNVDTDSLAIVLRTPAAFTQVSIHRRSILGAHVGVADTKKNFIGSLVIVGAVAAIAVKGFQGNGNSRVGDGGGIDETRVPFFGFRIPFSFGFGR
jgi:hypothetical protein